MIDLKHQFANGKDYYDIVVDIIAKEYFMVKNAASFAAVHKEMKRIHLGEYADWRFKVYSNGNDPEPDIVRIPLKFRNFTFKK